MVRDTGIEPEGSDPGRRHWWYQFDFAQREGVHHQTRRRAVLPHPGIPTGEIVVAPQSGRLCTYRGLMMPARKRTRAQDRAYRIARERAPNEVRICLERKQEFREWLHTKCEPPPF